MTDGTKITTITIIAGLGLWAAIAITAVAVELKPAINAVFLGLVGMWLCICVAFLLGRKR